ncbi:hypothetical protein SMACR_00577 [Sordaria macrospora]|uniref:WGS project CABT00000000 data, contig 2.1 n=2 Tax=Sordaria macrospora TaxID=5147 RepID=F7VLI5_SORMK|nr:uncharacterized protein SMAC_00577 [Sordaria macrospora k-hell]KAA8635483.1 hypothetical protein SMACR_00577 [Sordaria macrospora]WPJ59329.1 hypothetical protein SMAC4_00577 [Sordaria macrospora]CCC06363.1 unnamed protein product [Sordaria macrospora k-hell]
MAALNLLDFSYCGIVLRRNLDSFHDACDGEPSLFDDFIPTEHDDESVTQSFSSIWQQRPLSDSTPPLSATVSREPFQFHGICHSNDSSDSKTPLSGELLWSLGSLSVLNVLVKTPERYEHIAVPLSSDLYMVREKAYVDYIPCPGSGPGSPALSVLSEAALPEIDDDFPRIDDSRPVITDIEPIVEETSKIEERSILQPSQTSDWLAIVLEKRQATPKNEKVSALLKEQAAFDVEQLMSAVRDQRKQNEFYKPRLNKRTRMRSSLPPQSRKKSKNSLRAPPPPSPSPVPGYLQYPQYLPHQGWTG